MREDEINYTELFGLEEGGKERELAEPVADEADAHGENEQELADPADNIEDTDTENKIEQTPEEPAQDAQTPEERSKYAAARRKAEAERDAAIEKAKAEAAAEAQRIIDKAFAESGLTDPYTKTPITTKAEYDAYRKRFEEEKKARLLRKSGMTDEEFGKFVSELPEVKQAREAQRAAEEAAKQAQMAQAKAKADEQLKAIQEINPNISSLADIAKMDTFPHFYELVKKGNNFFDAFRIANFDSIYKNAAAASRQAAMNSERSKRHLAQTQTRGVGAVTVPRDVSDAYRAFNPDATDAEIQRHYNNYLKK